MKLVITCNNFSLSCILLIILGDYAIYVRFGFTHWQAIFINFISSLTCFIGFYTGASLQSESEAADWILCITSGMFFYISLVDLVNIDFCT